jgi:cell division protein FtsB
MKTSSTPPDVFQLTASLCGSNYAINGLSSELAAAHRELSAAQAEIEKLKAEVAKLTLGPPPVNS